MSDAAGYVVSWIRTEVSVFRTLSEQWTANVFNAEIFSFNAAASRYFELNDQEPGNTYGIQRVEVKMTDVEIEITERDKED